MTVDLWIIPELKTKPRFATPGTADGFCGPQPDADRSAVIVFRHARS